MKKTTFLSPTELRIDTRTFRVGVDIGGTFTDIVLLNQSVTLKEKNRYFTALLKCRGYEKANPSIKKLYQYFSEWYHVSIREMLTLNSLSPSAISKKLFPEVSLKKVNSSIKLMLELGFIKKTKNEKFQQVFPDIPRDNEFISLMILNYHINMSEHASKHIDCFGPELRDLSSVTISVKKESIEQLKTLMSSFKKKLISFAYDIKNPDEVVQVNFQMLPLTDFKGK